MIVLVIILISLLIGLVRILKGKDSAIKYEQD